MNQVNFRIDYSGKDESSKLVLEGDRASLELIRQRINDVIDNELNKTNAVTFDKNKQKITFNNKSIEFEIKECNQILPNSWHMNRNLMIALSISIASLCLVLIAVVMSGKGK